MTSLREVLLAKLAQTRASLEYLGRQGESAFTALEWQKGYAKALEEVLDLDGLSLRRFPRRPTAIPATIARFHRGAPAAERGEGTIVDLSTGGCGLATALEIAAGERIEISFRLPGRNAGVSLEGVARRAARVGEVVRAGVEFVKVPDHVLVALETFLAVPVAVGAR